MQYYIITMIALSTPRLWLFSPFPHPILHIRLLDIGPGQLVQRGIEGQVAQGGVENVDDIQLGNTGGHGAGAEEGLIGGGIELFIGQIGGIAATGPSNSERCGSRPVDSAPLAHLCQRNND